MTRVCLRIGLPHEELVVDLEPGSITNASDHVELVEKMLATAVADATAWIEGRKRKPAAKEGAAT